MNRLAWPPSGAPNNAPTPAVDVSFGDLGTDGLGRLVTFPGFALTDHQRCWYQRERDCPCDGRVKRIVVNTEGAPGTRLTIDVTRKGKTHQLFTSFCELLTVGAPELFLWPTETLHIGDLLTLTVRDERPRVPPRYWSNLSGKPWWRAFGAIIVLARPDGSRSRAFWGQR